MPFTACHFLRQSLTEGDEDEEETHDSDEEEESVRYARANNQGSVLGFQNNVMVVSRTSLPEVEIQL